LGRPVESSDVRSGVIRFGEYEADLRSAELWKRGTRIKLAGKSFEVLALLLEHHGELVTREELRARLWPADVFVDFEHNLNSAVGRLREALRDSAEKPRFIETLPRRGYRFIARLPETPARIPSPARRIKLAVLPLENLSGDPSQEYFSDGMTEELITQLASLAPERLGVIARTLKSPSRPERVGRRQSCGTDRLPNLTLRNCLYYHTCGIADEVPTSIKKAPFVRAGAEAGPIRATSATLQSRRARCYWRCSDRSGWRQWPDSSRRERPRS